MKLYKLFMKYKYCIAGILIFVIIYNSTQSIVENMSDAQKRKKIKEEKLSIKHLDGALTYFESIVKSEDERLMVTVDASRKKKILAALDKMDYWINNSIVMMIFRSKAKTQSKYYNELVKFFGKEGRHIFLPLIEGKGIYILQNLDNIGFKSESISSIIIKNLVV